MSSSDINNFTILKVLDYTEDKFIEREEIIDVNKLNFITENEDLFKDLLREDKRLQFTLGNDYNPSAIFTMAREYLNRSRGGKVKVLYKQKLGVGRFFAVNSMSLQSITRQIRQTISDGIYMDIDMKNCHPNILLFICNNLNIQCDTLRKYCNNRDEFFKENNLTKPVGKQLILSILNGGKADYKKLDNPTDEITEFLEVEIPNIHDKICLLFKEVLKNHIKTRKAKGKDYNHKASLVNHILCDIESKILEVMSEFFGHDKNEVLCFDGIMLTDFKNQTGQKLTTLNKVVVDLQGCEKAIYDKLKIKIQLDIKPFEDIFDLSGHVIMPFIEITDEQYNIYLKVKNKIYYYHSNDDINDNTLSIIFFDMMKDKLITTSETGDGFIWDDKSCLWLEKTANELMVEICNENNLILKALKELSKDAEYQIIQLPETEKAKIQHLNDLLHRYNGTKHDIQTSRGIKDIFTLAKNRFRDDKFKTDKINRNHDFLPIRNGKVINLIDGTIRDRTKKDLFSSSCDVDFIPEKDTSPDDKKDLYKFVNQIGMDNEEYIKYKQVKMGSYLSGQNSRDIDINHGKGKNGKSTEVFALKLVLGDFCGFIGKDVVVFDKSQHRKKGGGNHTSHLVPINGKRLIITQELEENDIIDSEMVKKIASSDPIEGVRECYGRKTWTMIPFCKLAICSNHMPKFDINDIAITDRLTFNPYKARFLNKISMENEKANGNYDTTKYNYYETDEELINKYKTHGRTIDVYFSWLIAGCIEFYKTKNNGIYKPKIVLDYINEKTSENDVVGLWIDERCNIKTVDEWFVMSCKDRKVYTSSTSILYDDFSIWANKNSLHKGVGKIDFNKRLENQFSKKRMTDGMCFERISLISTIF